MCGYFGTKKKNIVLLNYPLGLPLLNIGMCGYFGTKKKSGSNRCSPLNSSISLLKYKNMWVFWNKKKSGSNKCSPLNSSIELRT